MTDLAHTRTTTENENVRGSVNENANPEVKSAPGSLNAINEDLQLARESLGKITTTDFTIGYHHREAHNALYNSSQRMLKGDYKNPVAGALAKNLCSIFNDAKHDGLLAVTATNTETVLKNLQAMGTIGLALHRLQATNDERAKLGMDPVDMPKMPCDVWAVSAFCQHFDIAASRKGGNWKVSSARVFTGLRATEMLHWDQVKPLQASSGSKNQR
jgi:hypothetical protein